MRNTLFTLLSSVLKAAAVSGIFAGIAYLSGHSPLLWFVVTFVAQFVVFYLYGVYLDYRAARDTRALALKELEILSKITFNVPCAACKQINEVVINAREDTTFECQFCKAKNAVYMNVESAVITNPIATNNLN
jgi:phage FluMu protein Com